MTAFNGYPFSVFLAVLMHGLILGSLFLFQRVNSEVVDVVRPTVIKALLVEENPQIRNERVQQQVTQQRAEEQRRQEQARQEQARQEQARQEQARQEQARQEQARQEEARRQEEQRQAAVRQQQQREQQEREQREREQQERERQEQQRREQERQEQQRAEEQRRQEEQRQQELARQQEAAASAARELAETEAEQVMAYTAIIHDLVQRNWSRPPSARNNMTVVIRIRLVPTGDVVDVEIVRSSGDAAFDRSAESAVRAVGRFRELANMPPRMFERNFRSLLLTFRPEDLLN